uniref:Uncharacterized protein n=1 Tax=Arundo donax TaxID=35708 RepID=A0A0A9EXW6_ARUDO
MAKHEQLILSKTYLTSWHVHLNYRLLVCKGFLWLADSFAEKQLTTSESLLSSFNSKLIGLSCYQRKNSTIHTII